MENRSRYDRNKPGRPSDMIAADGALIARLIRPATLELDLRALASGLFYRLGMDCEWRPILKNLPPDSLLLGDVIRPNWDGTLERLRHVLHGPCRKQVGRPRSSVTC